MKNDMRFSSYQIHHIMQVYIDKLSSGEDTKKAFQEENGNTVSEADSRIIAERIINDITGRINNICISGSEPKKRAGIFDKDTIPNDGRFRTGCGGAFLTSEIEPASAAGKDIEKTIGEKRNYVYNYIDESGEKKSREISLSDSGFLIKKT
ncbi:MAG: hypothetical protein EHM30_00175 [Desulfobacteraceae bacterium]|nr:MAG: hypothetical protein EHM30_00175 [Desulfobacteraceae bacterium]